MTQSSASSCIVAVITSHQQHADVGVAGNRDTDAASMLNDAVAASTGDGSPGRTATTPVRITSDVDGCGVAVIGVVGELVIDTADELRAAITTVLGSYPVTRVVVDLARVSFLDMAALSALLRSRTAALQAGASFHAIRPTPLVRRVLHLTGTCLLLTTAPQPLRTACEPSRLVT